MSKWEDVARQAVRGAFEVRRRAGISKLEPICVYDLAEHLGIEVRFCGGNSFEGMYAKASQTVLVPALRPPGRQAFACAHELGHWFFGHGTHVDSLQDIGLSGQLNLNERLANIFASYLLMTPWAAGETFKRRGVNPALCTPLQAYIVAGQLGVGYETLIQHLRWSLRVASDGHSEQLLKTTPKAIRRQVLGSFDTGHLIIADLAWVAVPIDLRVGDLAILPHYASLEGRSAAIVGATDLGLVIEGRVPGIARAESRDGSWAAFVRVRRQEFQGRSIYRHLEDADVDEGPDSDQ